MATRVRDLCEFVQGAKSFHPRVFKASPSFQRSHYRECSSARASSFVRSVPALPAACAAYPTASRDDLALATPACPQPLACPVRGGRCFSRLVLPRCTRMRSQPGVSRWHRRAPRSSSSRIIPCAASLPDRTPRPHPDPPTSFARAQFSSKQVGNDAFPPRAHPAVRCGHAPCTTRVPFLDSLARAVSQERAAVCRARAHRHRRSPRCRSLAASCARRNREHTRSPQFCGASRGATGCAERICRRTVSTILRVSVVGLLSVLIP